MAANNWCFDGLCDCSIMNTKYVIKLWMKKKYSKSNNCYLGWTTFLKTSHFYDKGIFKFHQSQRSEPCRSPPRLPTHLECPNLLWTVAWPTLFSLLSPWLWACLPVSVAKLIRKTLRTFCHLLRTDWLSSNRIFVLYAGMTGFCMWMFW
jgi:hypothetical protein